MHITSVPTLAANPAIKRSASILNSSPFQPSSQHIDSTPDTNTMSVDAVSGGVKRRRRGAARLSCAECRRLKLRCDRKVPCDSCVKRGCGAICPDGSLTTGRGNRFVLASTTELHDKISDLSIRVRELEDALRASHGQHSRDTHPLLTDELLKIKAPLQREIPLDRDGPVKTGSPGAPGHNGIKEENNEVVDSFGSLSIGLGGKTKYYGSFANSWYFLQNEDRDEEQEDHSAAVEAVLPPEIVAMGSSFPSSPSSSPILSENLNGRKISTTNLVWYLPMADKATELVEIYYERASWMYSPISKAQFEADIFSPYFSSSLSSSSAVNTLSTPTSPSSSLSANGTPLSPISSGRLSVLFMVLAIGTLMDPNNEAYNIEAEKYHQIARAALFSTRPSVFDDPTLQSVQALFLMSYYLFLAERHGTISGSRWIIMGFAVKLAQSIGLHRDSTRWKMDAEETQLRREVFWELYTCDSWQCLTFGRPPSFSLPHVDCKFPHPTEDPTGERSFDTWKHHFSAECMSIVHDQAFGAKTPSYQTILQIDRKLRGFPVPSVLQIAGFGGAEGNANANGDAGEGYNGPESLGLIMQRHIVLAIREMNLLYMHRGYFARAISDNPKDPLSSQYGTSVIAAYRSAGSLVAVVRNLDSQLPQPTERLWFLWTHLFSCAVVLGSIVTRCPSMSIAPSALVQLDSACELFAKVAQVFRAEKVLHIMLNLQHKARNALQDHREGRHGVPSYPYSGHNESMSPSEDDDELSKLGGKTRYHKDADQTKSPSPTSATVGGSSLSLHAVTRSPNTQNPVVPFPIQQTEVHLDPQAREYLQTFSHTGMGMASMHMQQDSEMGNVPSGEEPSMFQGTSPTMYSARGPSHSATVLNPDVTFVGRDSYGVHTQAQNIGTMVDGLPSGSRQNSMGGNSHGYTSPVVHQPHHGQPPNTTYLPQYFPVFDYGVPSNVGYSSLVLQTQQQSPASASSGNMGRPMSSFDFGSQSAFGASYLMQNGHQTQGNVNTHSDWVDLVQEFI